MAASTRWLLAVAATSAALVVISLLVALGTDRETALPPDSPEGVVQSYLQAVAESDSSAVLALFSPDLLDRCDSSQIRDSIRWRPDDFRATLGEVTQRDETTEVGVTITEVYGTGPFGRNESTFEQVFVLTQTEEGWRFVEPPWPTWCPVPARPISSAPPGGPADSIESWS